MTPSVSPTLSYFRDLDRRWYLRGLTLVVVVALVASATALSVAYEPPELEPGNVDQQANGTTIVAVQGFHFKGEGDKKKPARLVGLDPEGNVDWVYNGSERGASWFYDSDPLPNGDILAVNTMQRDGQGVTQVYRLDPETKERDWEVTLDLTDTHDVDLINGDQLLVANMRQWNGSADVSNDRLAIYDISGVINGSQDEVTEDDVVWEWQFKDHYPNETEGGMNEDWTHVNDVDEIAPGEYLASPRNFDQVIVVNRSTGEIDLQLGSDGDHDVIHEQHNPMYLETDDGTPTILVADSENDRVVEYTCTETADDDCEWERVWTVGEDQLNWPRDADRLPNGNTLIVDSMGHRVVEVTPKGKIVWESYVPWAPYDVERMVYGDEGDQVYDDPSDAPTMRDMDVSGTYELQNSSGLTAGTEGGEQTFPQWLKVTFGGTPLEGPIFEFAELWESGSQWAKPVWMAPWSLVYLTAAALLVLGWAAAELVFQRRQIGRVVRRAAARLG
ncbi:MAG: arylsulfotransferase family protein [Halanaeroarchaeum sp.]